MIRALSEQPLRSVRSPTGEKRHTRDQKSAMLPAPYVNIEGVLDQVEGHDLVMPANFSIGIPQACDNLSASTSRSTFPFLDPQIDRSLPQSGVKGHTSTCQPVDTLAAVDKRWLTGGEDAVCLRSNFPNPQGRSGGYNDHQETWHIAVAQKG
jgi:hypothetical protein